MSELDSHIAECRRSGFGMSGPLLAKGQQARGSLVKFFQPGLAQGGNSGAYFTQTNLDIVYITFRLGEIHEFWSAFGLFYIFVHLGPFSFSF